MNDVIKISYSLLQALSPVPVTVEIYDLSGSRTWHTGASQTRGYYEVEWDGTMDDGKRVLPGIYIYRIIARTQKGDQSRVGTIAVTY
jgi:flagellar hook assembly protein FlgD